jgi:acyl-CoA thioester hydrolase
MENHQNSQIYKFFFTIPESALDQNGHVNNVSYVQWMQDIAVRHYDFMGGTKPTQELGATWVVSTHKIEYLKPAYVGDEIEAQTWVANIRRARSLRKYRFLRRSDQVLLVRGETDWVFVDAKTGRPCRIPAEIVKVLCLPT